MQAPDLQWDLFRVVDADKERLHEVDLGVMPRILILRAIFLQAEHNVGWQLWAVKEV